MGRTRQDQLRAMYAGGRGNAVARRYARFWNRVLRLGVLPASLVTLEVTGRRTGRTTRFPVVLADVGGDSYVVSMLGECDWVRNVRAAQGRAVLRRRRASPVLLEEVPVDQRAPVLKSYVRRAIGGRPHIAVDHRQPVEAFEAVAADHPVFRICYQDR